MASSSGGFDGPKSAQCLLGAQNPPKGFPDAHGPTPPERAPAFEATAPAIVVEVKLPGLADATDAFRRLQDSPLPPFRDDEGLKPEDGIVRVAGEGQPAHVVSPSEDIAGLSKEGSDLLGIEAVGLRLLHEGLVRRDDLLGPPHLRFPELQGLLDLPLLALHREALRALRQLPGPDVLVLVRDEPRLSQVRFSLVRIRPDRAREGDVVLDGRQDGLDFLDASVSRLRRKPRGNRELFPSLLHLAGFEATRRAVPRFLRQGDGASHVCSLPNRVPHGRELISDAPRFRIRGGLLLRGCVETFATRPGNVWTLPW